MKRTWKLLGSIAFHKMWKNNMQTHTEQLKCNSSVRVAENKKRLENIKIINYSHKFLSSLFYLKYTYRYYNIIRLSVKGRDETIFAISKCHFIGGTVANKSSYRKSCPFTTTRKQEFIHSVFLEMQDLMKAAEDSPTMWHPGHNTLNQYACGPNKEILVKQCKQLKAF